MTDVSRASGPSGNQLRLTAIVLGACMAVLIVGYLAFLRYNYAVLYSDLTPHQASLLVTELEARDVPFRISDNGQTILVASGLANELRLSIDGARSPMSQVVGFELFNESDMGLTDFAQRIKYQRALEGELARTIMLMDGIDQARVHISLPERALFQADKVAPKAAVTLSARSLSQAGQARILGVQKLVAAAVPELTVSDVVVLNEAGETISASADLELAISDPGSQTGEQTARVIQKLVEQALAATFDGTGFTIVVRAVTPYDDSRSPDAESAEEAGRFPDPSARF